MSEVPQAAEDTVVVAPEPVEEPKITAGDMAKHKAVVGATFARLNAEPKERIRIPKSAGPQTVIINGARYDIAANVPVEVPETVAKHLRKAERI